jgi:hypothetical protein
MALGIKQYFALAANFAVTTNTTLATVTGMSLTVSAAQKWNIRCFLPFLVAGTAPGAKVNLTPSAAATSYVASFLMWDLTTATAVLFAGQTFVASTAFGATLNVTGDHLIEINATIVASAAGTIDLQYAQNVSDAAASTLIAGAFMECPLIP